MEIQGRIWQQNDSLTCVKKDVKSHYEGNSVLIQKTMNYSSLLSFCLWVAFWLTLINSMWQKWQHVMLRKFSRLALWRLKASAYSLAISNAIWNQDSSTSKSREPWKKGGATQSVFRKEQSTTVAPAITSEMADTEPIVDIQLAASWLAAASVNPAQTSTRNT